MDILFRISTFCCILTHLPLHIVWNSFRFSESVHRWWTVANGRFALIAVHIRFHAMKNEFPATATIHSEKFREI